MNVKGFLVEVLALTALTMPLSGFSYYTDQWVSGTKLYASATTDTDGGTEWASSSVSIQGASGFSSGSYCSWYNAAASTSLSMTSTGTHTITSGFVITGSDLITILLEAEYTHGVEINYGFDFGTTSSCTFSVSCPGAGGGSSPICTNAPSSITVSKQGTIPCFDYGFLEYAGAIKLPILTNRLCMFETARGMSTVQHECTAPLA